MTLFIHQTWSNSLADFNMSLYAFKVVHIKIATVWPTFLFVLEAICDTCKCSL